MEDKIPWEQRPEVKERRKVYKAHWYQVHKERLTEKQRQYRANKRKQKNK